MADDALLDILGKLKLRTARLSAVSAPGNGLFPSPFTVQSLAVSPDGRRVAVGRADKALSFLDGSTLEPSGDPERPALDVKRVRFSVDGTVLFYQTPERAGTFRVEPPLPGIDIPGFDARHDAFLAPASGKLLRVDRSHIASFDIEDARPAGQVAIIEAGGPEAKAAWRILDVASDGRFALAVKWRQGGAIVRRLDLTTGRGPEATAPLPGAMGGGAALAPGGAWAVVADNWGNCATLDLDTMRFAMPHVDKTRDSVWAIAASPDGRHWASAISRQLWLWRLASEHPVEKIDIGAIDDVPRALAFGPDGALLAGTASGRVLRFEIDRAA